MKKIILTVIFIFIFQCSAIICSADFNITKVYVSPMGSDSVGTGEYNAPFASVQKAKLYVRTLPKTSPIEVVILDGEYAIGETIVFSDEDSGLQNAPITYKANSTNVIFTGAKTINSKDFSKVIDPAVVKKIRREARGQIYEVNLKNYGINISKTDANRVKLFVNKLSQTEARYPNDGFIKVLNSQNANVFTFDDNRVNSWSNAKDSIFTGSLSATFFWAATKINSIENGNLTTDADVRNGALGYISNLLEEIDGKGEYYIDKSNGILYYYPIDNFENSIIEVETRLSSTDIISVRNANYINFDGVTFEKSYGTTFRVSNSSNININKCNFNYLNSSYAIVISGENINISDNTVNGLSGGFVTFQGGERKTLTPGNIFIQNNRITNCGNALTYINYIIGSGENSPSSDSNSIGNVIKNNIIENCSSVYAISPVGNDNKILYNEIYNVSRHIDDGGTIYFGRSNTKYGNEVAYNYIHHLNKEHLFAGLYADDGYGGLNMHHNVLNSMASPIHIGMGMNNKFDNNIIIDVDKGIRAQTRMTWGENFAQNGALYQETYRLMELSSSKTAFAQAYPDLALSIKRTPFFAPYNSQITGNVSFGKVKPLYETPNHSYYKNNTTQLSIAGEDNVSNINDALYLSGTTKYVNELKAYGSKIKSQSGEDLNATLQGNPQFAYNTSYFKNADLQDFTLTNAFSSSVSTVNEIDMSQIGIKDSSNPNTFAHNGVFNVNTPTYSDDKMILSWEKVKNASLYTVTFSENQDMSNIVLQQEVYDNNLDFAYTANTLKRGQKYYISVSAKGISKQDMFTLNSNKIEYTTPPLNTTLYLTFANSLLETEIQKYQSGLYIYENTNIINNLNECKQNATQIIANPTTQNEIVAVENSIYDLLEIAAQTRTMKNARILKCETVSSDTIVNVEAAGFKPYDLVNILVTNPSYNDKDILIDSSTKTIQYVAMATADYEGNVKFSFDTKNADVDFEAIYNVYLKSQTGLSVNATYAYATIDISDITFKSNDTVINKSDIVNYKGQKLKAQFSVNNRLSKDIAPSIIFGVYKNNCLKSVTTQTESILKKTMGTVTLEWSVPMDYSVDSDISIMILESNELLKPYTLKKIISKL